VKTEPDLIALFRLPGVVAAPGLTRELQSEERRNGWAPNWKRAWHRRWGAWNDAPV